MASSRNVSRCVATASVTRGSADTDVPGGAVAVGTVHPAGHHVGGVALDGVDLAVGVDRLDDADVLAAPDHEVAGVGLGAGAVGRPAAGALRPAGQRGDPAEALAGLAQRRARLLRRPGDEVGAPGTD